MASDASTHATNSSEEDAAVSRTETPTRHALRDVADRHAEAVPVTILIAWLSLLAAILAGYFFVVFCLARGLLTGIGFPPAILVPCLGMTLVMAGFIIWLAPISQLPELWYAHWRPLARVRRGLCPWCGYASQQQDRSSPEDGMRCPECGSAQTFQSRLQFDFSTVRRFTIVCSAAYIVGCVSAMAWLYVDEQAFVRDCALHPTQPQSRPRAWPARFAILHYDGSRVSSVSIAEPLLAPPPVRSNQETATGAAEGGSAGG